MTVRRLSILGVGLLGGSMGLAARRVWPACRVVGYGHRQSSLDRALALGAIDEAFTDAPRAVDGADLVVLCTPVGTFESLLTSIAPAVASGAIVTDVGSTKRSVVTAAERILPAGVRFVGSHPMAGSEKRGVEFSRADLFQGATCVVTPTPRTDPHALREVEKFWRALGMKLRTLSPDDHDRLLADVSHLPHVLAAALVTMQEDGGLDVCGKGFIDATRIASGDGALWSDILIDNRANLRASVERVKQALDHAVTLIEADNPEALQAWLNSAARRRDALLEHRAGQSEIARNDAAPNGQGPVTPL